MPKLKEDIDYKLVFKEGSDFHSIKLLSGDYEGVIYTYGRVSIGGERDDGRLPLSFKWKLEEKPDSVKEDIEKSAEFQNYIGDILADIIIDSKVVENARKNTNDNTEETDSE